MTRRALTLILAAVFIVAVAAVVIGCSSPDATTTTASTLQTDTTGGTGSSDTVEPGSTTSIEADSGPSSTTTKDTDELSTTTSAKQTGSSSDYAVQMKAWVQSLSNMPDTTTMEVTDPAQATTKQIASAKDAASEAHKYLDTLNKLKPTAALTDVHESIVQAFQGLVASFDSYVIALKEKSADGIAESKEVGRAAEAELEKYFTALAP